MKANHIAIATTAAISMFAATCVQSKADLPVFDPLNYAQNELIQANTLKSTLDQATQIAYQVQQLKLEIESMRNVPKGVWGEIKSDLAQLRSVVESGEGIGYADTSVSRKFSALYPGFTSTTDYTTAYQRWSQSSLSGLETSLEDAGLQSRQLDSETNVLASLSSMSDGAQGQLQALQVANMIAMQQVEQLQKLRQLQMAEIQAQVGYLATQQQVQASQYAALKTWLASTATSTYKF
jgi:P-type conjugative transfer protein TrbJ